MCGAKAGVVTAEDRPGKQWQGPGSLPSQSGDQKSHTGIERGGYGPLHSCVTGGYDSARAG